MTPLERWIEVTIEAGGNDGVFAVFVVFFVLIGIPVLLITAVLSFFFPPKRL